MTTRTPATLHYIHRAEVAHVVTVLPPRGGLEHEAPNRPDLQLRTLEIYYYQTYLIPLYITRNMFGGVAYSLTNLTLLHSGLHLLSDAPFMPALRTLSLRVISIDPRFVWLARLLAKTPELKQLHVHVLHMVVLGEDEQIMQSVSPITFRNLKVAAATLKPQPLAALLRILPIPSEALSVEAMYVSHLVGFGPEIRPAISTASLMSCTSKASSPRLANGQRRKKIWSTRMG